MSNDPKLVNESVKPDDLIMTAPLSELNMTELTRRKLLTDILSQEAEREDAIERLADRQNKRNTKSQEYESRGRELVKTGRDQAAVQAICQHRKGGRGNIPGGFLKGNDVNYSVIKHTLPTNKTWIRCTRCGRTWKDISPLDYDMKSVEGKAAYEKAKAEYLVALDFNTDNSPSSSITFSFSSEDQNVTADKFVHDVMQNVNLR